MFYLNSIEIFFFCNFEEFVEKYNYDSNVLIYFKTDGHSFKKETMLADDDNSVRKLVKLCKPYGRMYLYVDQFDLDELIDVPKIVEQTNNATIMGEKETGQTQKLRDDKDFFYNEGYNDDIDDPE